MRCYKCDTVLSENDFCNSCGADVVLYKKIVKMSNMYYNIALEKAKVRDLSGAIDYLRRSVRLYKRNTNARNLLGLVYYEMGDVVEALSEWVISKNFQADKNLADDYINAVQNNPARLETINQTIKKYNMALSYAVQGSDDLAVIQLKKVLTLNPNLVKGHQLLALLHIKNQDYEKAKKSIQKSLKIDTTNTLSIRYLNEINEFYTESEEKNAISDKRKFGKDKQKDSLNGNDVIIPTNSYKEINNGSITVINIIIGILIGAAVIFFLVTPARTKALRDDFNQSVKEYTEKVNKLTSTNTELESQIDLLTKENEELEEQAVSDSSMQVVYDSLIQAYNAYKANDYVTGANALSLVTTTEGMTETFMNIYNEIHDTLYSRAASSLFNSGTSAMNNADYPKAIDDLTKSVKYDASKANALYNLAKSYNLSGDTENAKVTFNKVIELFPNTSQATNAATYLD